MAVADARGAPREGGRLGVRWGGAGVGRAKAGGVRGLQDTGHGGGGATLKTALVGRAARDQTSCSQNRSERL